MWIKIFCFPFSYKKFKYFRTVILQVVVLRCETRSLTLSENHRSNVVENRALRSRTSEGGSNRRLQKAAQ
jgi:hypothetical protein